MDTIDGLAVRSVTGDEFEAFARAVEAAFGTEPPSADVPIWREIMDLDRTWAVFDTGRIVATAAADPFDLTVPGGAAVGMAGVTAVGVHPTHRRRGLLTGMMRRMLEDARDRGEPTAGLWASESVIYGRFGFGWAASGAWTSLPTRGARLRGAATGGQVRFLDAADVPTSLPGIYERSRAATPGLLSWDRARWRFLEQDPEDRRDGAGPRFLVAYGDRGYAYYRLKQDWTDGLPKHTLVLGSLVAVDAEAELGLWEFLASIDLVGRIEAANRPVDEVLPLALADPRALRTRTSDTLWLRLLDVPAGLGARRYGADGALTIAVDDPFCPWAAGTFRLEAAGGAGVCEPDAGPADLSLGASELGAIYLGGTRPSRLARAGRVDVRRAEALPLADAMFASAPLPWCPFEF